VIGGHDVLNQSGAALAPHQGREGERSTGG